MSAFASASNAFGRPFAYSYPYLPSNASNFPSSGLSSGNAPRPEQHFAIRDSYHPTQQTLRSTGPTPRTSTLRDLFSRLIWNSNDRAEREPLEEEGGYGLFPSQSHESNLGVGGPLEEEMGSSDSHPDLRPTGRSVRFSEHVPSEETFRNRHLGGDERPDHGRGTSVDLDTLYRTLDSLPDDYLENTAAHLKTLLLDRGIGIRSDPAESEETYPPRGRARCRAGSHPPPAGEIPSSTNQTGDPTSGSRRTGDPYLKESLVKPDLAAQITENVLISQGARDCFAEMTPQQVVNHCAYITQQARDEPI
ncbi:hypothetical protein P7C73_g5793, partial [Tremellales sp. Uapishka_1]